jgi:hypothetical protein
MLIMASYHSASSLSEECFRQASDYGTID